MSPEQDIAVVELGVQALGRSRARAWAPWQVVLASFVSTLLFAEVFVRLMPVERLPASAIQSLLVRKAAWLARQPPAEVLVVGDSTGHRDIEVEAFREAAGGASTLNAAITSGSPIVVRAMLREVPWKPRHILFAASPFLLSDGWTSEPHEVEVSTFSERVALMGLAPAIVSTSWQTYRRRVWVRSMLKRALLGGRTSGTGLDFGPGVGFEDAFGSLAIDRQRFEDEEGSAAKWRSWTEKGLVLDARWAALNALAAGWQAEKIDVVYALMPVHSSLRALGAAEPEAWSFEAEALAALAGMHGGRVIDCRSAVADEGFYDADHLRRGAPRDAFSRALGAVVADREGALEESGCIPIGSRPGGGA